MKNDAVSPYKLIVFSFRCGINVFKMSNSQLSPAAEPAPKKELTPNVLQVGASAPSSRRSSVVSSVGEISDFPVPESSSGRVKSPKSPKLYKQSSARYSNFFGRPSADGVSIGCVRALASGFTQEMTHHIPNIPSMAGQQSASKNNVSTDAVPTDCLLHQCLENERFHKSFSHAKVIGVGGMGSVVAAQHIADGRWSAVKLIPFTAHGDARERDQFAEVAALKDLSSRHVVRYEEHWLEEYSCVADLLPPSAFGVNGGPVPKISPKARSSASRGLRMGPSREGTLRKNVRDAVIAEGSSASSWAFSDATEDSCGVEWIIDEEDEAALASSSENQSQDHSGRNADATIEHVPRNKSGDKKSKKEPMYFVVLMIRMELCAAEPGSQVVITTLREWLDDDDRRDPKKAFEIFVSLMKGVRHIHRARFVHRDLKPANIFVQCEPKILVKIGDFGLASTVKGHVLRFVGTPPYIAPEVVAALNPCSGSQPSCSTSTPHSEAADIYSCGIMLLELLHPPFDTAHERHVALRDLLEFVKVPDSLPGYKNHRHRMQKLEALLLCMTHTDASSRANAEQVWRDIPDVETEWKHLVKFLARETRKHVETDESEPDASRNLKGRASFKELAPTTGAGSHEQNGNNGRKRSNKAKEKDKEKEVTISFLPGKKLGFTVDHSTCIVERVEKDSTAYKAGLRGGHMILRVDGDKISSNPKKFFAALQKRSSKKNAEVALVVNRKPNLDALFALQNAE